MHEREHQGVPLAAGRSLDALIAEKVFGCKVKRPFNPAEHPDLPQKEYERRRRWEQGYKCECPGHPHAIDDGDYYGTDIKEYSTRIKDAWEVMEKLKLDTVGRHQGGWVCTNVADDFWFYAQDPERYDNLNNGIYLEWAPTAPHAIALAALKALGIS